MKKMILFFPIVVIVLMLFLPFYMSSDIDIKRLNEIIDTHVNDNLLKGNVRDFQMVFQCENDMFEDVIYYHAASFLNVDEVLVVKQSDTTKREILYDMVLTHIEKRKADFEGYGISQLEELEDALIKVEDDYVFCFVGKEAPKLWKQVKGEFSL